MEELYKEGARQHWDTTQAVSPACTNKGIIPNVTVMTAHS